MIYKTTPPRTAFNTENMLFSFSLFTIPDVRRIEMAHKVIIPLATILPCM